MDKNKTAVKTVAGIYVNVVSTINNTESPSVAEKTERYDKYIEDK